MMLVGLMFLARISLAQDNYEIQVYPSETQKPHTTMLELHSNLTAVGMDSSKGVRPTQSALHETLEITHGFTDWFELGFYVFTNVTPGYGWQWVGDHIRPRVRVPESWHWPVGVSLSAEVGYQRPQYAEDTWNLELRPIIDKDFRWIYISFNPTFGKSFKGLNQHAGFDFEPNLKVAWHTSKKVDLGLEYYGTTGAVFAPDPIRDQVHALYAAIDLNLDPRWEFNFGTGLGLTPATDGLVFKMILGRRLAF